MSQSRLLHQRLRRRDLSTIAVASVAVLLSALAVSPAQAEESFDPLAIIQAQNLIGEATDAPVADLDSAAQTLPVDAVDIIPVSDAPVQVQDDGSAVVEEENFGFVTALGTSGTNASFVVLRDESAPRSYDFEIGAAGTTLTLEDDGTVLVRDANGQVVNFLAAPWALDAEGRELPTHYTVNGNIVTQHVDTAGAVFPVTADPTTGCGPGWCSIYFNRSETAGIAAGSAAGAGAISVGCAAISKVYGGLCAVGFGIAAAVAQGAYGSGNCLGYFFSFAGHNPFVEPRGTSHCR